MKQTNKELEIQLPTWKNISNIFKNNKNIKKKNPEESIQLKKYVITTEELKKDYGIVGTIKELKIQNGNVELYTEQND